MLDPAGRPDPLLYFNPRGPSHRRHSPTNSILDGQSLIAYVRLDDGGRRPSDNPQRCSTASEYEVNDIDPESETRIYP